jgi:hypothetical protein
MKVSSKSMHRFGFRYVVGIGAAATGLVAASVAVAASSPTAQPVVKVATVKGGTFKPLPHRRGTYRLTLRGVDRGDVPAAAKRSPVVLALDHAGARHDAVAVRLTNPRYSADGHTASYLARVLPASVLAGNSGLSNLEGRVDQSLPPQFGPGALIGDTSGQGTAAPEAGCPASVPGCVGTSSPSQVLVYDGESVQTVTVPAGVDGVDIEAIGGGGGSYDIDGYPQTVGADVRGELRVEPGEQLQVAVGGTGQDTYNGTKGKDARGGWGGLGSIGGDGPSTDGNIHSGGAGGGGATTIELSSSGAVTPEVIAGGGGGQGGYGLEQGGGGGQGGSPHNGNGNPGYTPQGGAGGKQGVLNTFSGGFGAHIGGGGGQGGGGGGGGFFVEAEDHGSVELKPGGGQGGAYGGGGYGGGGGAAGLSGANPQDMKNVTIKSAAEEFQSKNGQVSLTWLDN